MRLASATISSERLFSKLEGLSDIARVEPGAKIAALHPYLYAMSLIFDGCHYTPGLIALHFERPRCANCTNCGNPRHEVSAIFAVSAVTPSTRNYKKSCAAGNRGRLTFPEWWKTAAAKSAQMPVLRRTANAEGGFAIVSARCSPNRHRDCLLSSRDPAGLARFS